MNISESRKGAASVSFPQMIIFALPALVSSILLGPVAGILPALYAQEFGINLVLVGTILLAARIFDAVIDPAIGLLSDRTRSRFGPRKPWIIVGYAITLLAMVLLFRPLGTPDSTYLLVLMLLLYFGWSLFEIPYAAWTLELSRDSRTRSTINAYRAAALWIGGILFTIAPAIVPGSGGQMGFAALGTVALVLLVAAPVSILAAVAYVPRGELVAGEEQPSLAELWVSVKENRPFQIFAIVYLFIGLASGVSGAVSFIYISNYMGLGDRFTELFLPATLLGPLMIPVWALLLRRFDKYRVTATAFSLYACLMPLPWFISPGPQSFLPMVLVYCGLTIFSPLLMIAMPTIMGDIVDFDEWQTGKNRAGQYSALQTLLAKAAAAASGPLSLMIIGAFGFQPGAATNSEGAIFGLRLVHNLLPMLLLLPGLLFLWRFPLDDARHRVIEAELRARRAAQEAE